MAKKTRAQRRAQQGRGTPGAAPPAVVELEDQAELVEPSRPAAIRRLEGEDRATVAAMMRAAAEVERAQAGLSDVVATARDRGLSWAAIGWATGRTGEGARRRWGAEDR